MTLYPHQDPIRVLCAADDRYAPPLAVMLQSLFRHCRSRPVRVYVLVPDGFASASALLAPLGAAASMVTLTRIGKGQVAPCPLRSDLTLASYYRLLAAAVLPAEARRVIYLDCDLLVRADLAALWDTPLGGRIAAAVVDPGFKHHHVLGLEPGAPYFNSGVMLIDLDAWRREGVEEASLRFAAERPERLTWGDQCVLNWVLRDRWLPLAAVWNLQSRHIEACLPAAAPRRWLSMPPKLVRTARIVHFNAPMRPWLYMCEHPYKRAYLRYLARTAWAGDAFPDRYPSNVVAKHLNRLSPALATRFLAWNARRSPRLARNGEAATVLNAE